MWRVRLCIIGVLAAVGLYAAPASAHVQASDNGTSAVLHILPDDNPVAAKQTLIQFTFGGATTHLDMANCDCRLAIKQGSQTVSITKLEPLQGSRTVVTSSIKFPKEGVYNLVLTSKTFAINFVVRVDAAGGTTNVAGGVDVIFISVASLVMVAVLGYYAIAGGGRYGYTTKTTSK